MAEHRDLLAMEAGHATNHGMVIGETAIAVNFGPVREDPLHVLEHERALRIPGQLRFLPGAEMGRDLRPQIVNAIVKLLDLAADVLVLAW